MDRRWESTSGWSIRPSRGGLHWSASSALQVAAARRDAGESIEKVSRFLDHSSLAVTTTYLRRLEGQEDLSWRQAAEALGLWLALQRGLAIMHKEQTPDRWAVSSPVPRP
jgi:hypothetical protein